MNEEVPFKVPRTREGTFFEIVTVILILALWAITWYLYRNAPEQVPVRFGLNLNPDTVGSKNTILLMAALGTIFSAGMLVSAYRPDKSVNLPFEFSLPKQYVCVVRMVRLLAVEMAFLFIAVVLMMGTSHVGYYPMIFFAVVLLLIIATTIYYTVKIYKMK
ncbi:MAG: DUF1648 domain-containing protein [Prevotella sp.]|nr:DUF1648 domain-containing protein [Prevotella sp.]